MQTIKMRSLTAAILLAGAGAYVASASINDQAPANDFDVIGVMMTNGNYDTPCLASFSASGDFDFRILASSGVDALARGAFGDGEGNFYGVASKQIAKFDMSDWSRGIISWTDLDLSECGFPKTATYDLSTGTAYGCFEDVMYAWDPTYSICSFDLSSGKVTKLISLPGDDKGRAYGLACDARGNMYAILKYDQQNPNSYYPALYKVDLAAGKLHYIGSTGLMLNGYYTAAACDPDSGRLFFAADPNRAAGLYELDLETGAASLVLAMPGNEQFSGIYIPRTSTPADAPAIIDDLGISYADAEGNGKFSFTIPTITYGGDNLEGVVTYSVSCDGKTLLSGSGLPGTQVSEDVTVPGEGSVSIKVRLTAKGGASSESLLESWVGYDEPLAPAGVSAAGLGNSWALSWEAPAAGVHGGFVDKSNITYEVSLQPFGDKLGRGVSATDFSAELSLAEPACVTFEVTALSNGMKSRGGQSSKVVAGPGFELPYKENFNSQEAFDLFTVVDSNSDDATWQLYNGQDESYAQCHYSEMNPKDDWMFTPPLHLLAGNKYTLSFKASCLMVTSFEEILEVKLGKKPEPQAMDLTVLDPEKIDNKISWTWYDYSIVVTVDEEGDYYLGFHALSEPCQFRLAIDDIMMEGSAFGAPVPAEELAVVAAPQGDHRATLSFRTPLVANDGSEVGELVAATVFVNNRLVHTFENPKAGETLSLEIETEEGENDVDVYVENSAGRSIAAHTTVYTGKDLPAAPANFKATVTSEGVLLSWDSPEGMHGGTVDPAEVQYFIGRYVNGDIEIVAYGLQDATEVLDEYTADYQTVVTYGIAASNSLGDSPTVMSNSVIVGGEPLALPFKESFASGFVSSLWQNQVVDMQGVGSWRTYDPELDSVGVCDDDFGCIVFHPSAEGDRTRLFSGLMTLAHSAHPVLEFWYRGDSSDGQVLKVEANRNMTEWETLTELELNGANVWRCAKLPLDAYRDCECFQIAFQGVATNLKYIYVDNISIRDVKQHDLAVSLETRRTYSYGKPEKIEATVINMGEQPAGDYVVEFYADGKLLSSVEKSGLEPDESEFFSIEHSLGLGDGDSSEIEVKVVYEADEELDNNYVSSNTRNHMPLYPAPRDLAIAENPAGSLLSWSEPEEWVEPETEAVTEDFDSYDPFLIDDIGDWTLVDENGEDGTFGILGLHFPYRERAKSWQLFDLRALGITPSEDDKSWDGHSGNQFLVSFADKDRKTDDWLISPILSGEAQVITFWAKSINTFWYGNETYEVLASSTGTNIKDFKVISSGDVDMEWTAIRVKLPAGTKYFAIKCTSADKYIMALDDITYVPGTGMPDDFTLAGYNVYRNGSKVNDAPVAETSVKLTTVPGEDYAVTAVYTTGESRFSNVFTTSGLGEILGASDVEVAVNGSEIIVAGAEGIEVSIVAADGMMIYRGVPYGTLVRSVSPGIHIVKIGGKTMKVIVK